MLTRTAHPPFKIAMLLSVIIKQVDNNVLQHVILVAKRENQSASYCYIQITFLLDMLQVP